MMSGSGLKEGARGAGRATGAESTGGDGATGMTGAGVRALAHPARTTATKGTNRGMLETGREKNARGRAQLMRPAARAGGIYRATRARGMMRRGMTAIELVVVLSLIALMVSIVVPTFARLRDGIAVRNATAEAMSAFAIAREAAIVRGAHAGVTIDRPPGHMTVTVRGEMLLRRDLETTYGVTLSSTRDSTAYSPLGHGFGAANLSLVIARGRVAETIYVSREGRVRR